MAENQHTTPKPIIDLTTPRKQAEDALYEIGVITDIISKLSTLIISSSEDVCGSSFGWLATQLAERQEIVQEQISVGSFGRGGCTTGRAAWYPGLGNPWLRHVAGRSAVTTSSGEASH